MHFRLICNLILQIRHFFPTMTIHRRCMPIAKL